MTLETILTDFASDAIVVEISYFPQPEAQQEAFNKLLAETVRKINQLEEDIKPGMEMPL